MLPRRRGQPTLGRVTPPTSRFAVFGTTEQPLRAKDICHALGIATTANHAESLLAKLNRLVTRDVLTEDQPGLFALSATSAGPAIIPPGARRPCPPLHCAEPIG